MFCSNCGKEIDDNAVVCIHCGVATKNAQPTDTQEKRVNAFGIAGFVIGIVSMWLGVYFCIVSLLGLIFSGIGMSKMKVCRINGLAIAGLVLSIISLVIWGICWIVLGTVLLD